MTTVPRDAGRPCAWGELNEFSLWPIRIRWWAAPGLLAAVLAAQAAGVMFTAWTFILIAALVLVGNVLIYRSFPRRKDVLSSSPAERRQMVAWQATIDCGALYAITYLSGGVTSPFVVGFFLPVFGVSVLLPLRTAYRFCGAVLAGLCLEALAELVGWLPHQSIFFQGIDLVPAPHPLKALATLALLGAGMFLTAALAGSVIQTFRQQVQDLERLRETEVVFNRRLKSIFSILETIGSVHDLRQVLETAVAEVAAVMQVKGVSVKLLSEDGKLLRYAAAFGLPEAMVREKVVEVERSPLNKRVIEGQPFITGQVTAREMFQFGETLSEAQIQSVLFVPLHLEGRVIGILGAYCEKPERFGPEEVNFFRLAAGLVAVALENARAYETVTTMSHERTWFMMKAAHNLRAPLAGMLSILEVVRDGYLGPINEDQNEYLRRLDRRARTMLALVNELMALSRNRQRREADRAAATELTVLARRVQRTFQDKAAEKRISFQVSLPPGLPDVRGRLETVEQVLENLVSNAIKYTPAEGTVEVRFARANGTVRLEVSDTGIGIPAADRPKLFSEFFRADNAKAMDDVGTGLGLTIVKEIVDQLGGRIFVESEEGVGTIFVVHLPIAPEPAGS
ncbi:MAG: ATP-binding protein [Hyphomicrobiales bacterium]